MGSSEFVIIMVGLWIMAILSLYIGWKWITGSYTSLKKDDLDEKQ